MKKRDKGGQTAPPRTTYSVISGAMPRATPWRRSFFEEEAFGETSKEVSYEDGTPYKGGPIDFRTLLRHAPPGADLGRWMRLFGDTTFKSDPASSSLDVTITKEGRIQVRYNEDYLKKYVENYFDLYTMLFHELTHVATGQFVEEKVESIFRDPFWTTKQGDPIRCFAQELLIKHLEHTVLPQDRYHEISRRCFEGANPPETLLYRGSKHENFFLQMIARRLYGTGDFSVREVAHILRTLLEKEENQEGEGQEGEGQEGEGQEGEGQEGGSSGTPGKKTSSGPGQSSSKKNDSGEEEGEEGEEDESGAGSDKDKEREDGEGEDGEGEDGEGEDGEGEDGEGEDGEGEDGEGEEEADPSPGGRPSMSQALSNQMVSQSGFEEGMSEEEKKKALSALSAFLSGASKTGSHAYEFEAFMSQFDTVKNHYKIKRSLQKIAVKPSVYAQIGRVFEREVGQKKGKSVLPNPKDDRKGTVSLLHKSYHPFWKSPARAATTKFYLYYDISGSQNSYIPYCNEIVLRQRKNLHKGRVFVFSTYVYDHEKEDAWRREDKKKPSLGGVPITTFDAHARTGSVSGMGSGGTSFNSVIYHMFAQKVKKCAVLTDNDDYISDTLKLELTKWKEEGGFLLLISTVPERVLTRDGSRGFVPFADEIIYVDA